MERLKMCRICLCENVQLNSIVNTELQEVYQKLTSITFKTEDPRPMVVCYICCARLQKSLRLINNCLEADELFTQVLNGTVESLVLTNRPPKLSTTVIQPVNIDPELYLEDTIIKDELNDTDKNESGINCEYEFTMENTFSNEEEIRIKEEIGNISPEPKSTQEKKVQNTAKRKYKNQEFICYLCNTTHRNWFGYHRHMSNKHKENKNQFICDICSKEYTTKVTLIFHILAHRSENMEVKCKICDIPYRSAASLRRHLLNHKTGLPKCEKCDKVFYTKDGLKSHNIGVHNIGEKRFKCDKCHRAFVQSDQLKNHVRAKHTGERPYKCETCGKAYLQYAQLQVHKRIHTGEKPFHCDKCLKSFRALSTLEAHIETHSDRQYLSCNLCDKKFLSRSGLYRHIHAHSRDCEQKCEECNKVFPNWNELRLHQRNVHDQGTYKCDVCDKQLASMQSLQSHKLMHTGEKRCACTMCPKVFTEGRYLRIHMRTHTGEKPHKCEICEKSFAQRTPLVTHMRSVHGKDNPSKCQKPEMGTKKVR